MSMNAAPTITEFLLARIAKEEDKAGDMLDCLDKTRRMRECAAKRAITGMHRNDPSPYGDQYCATCAEVGQDGKEFPCETVKAVAAIYSDHPDYQQEWALSGTR